MGEGFKLLINPYRKLGLFETSGCKYALANLGGPGMHSESQFCKGFVCRSRYVTVKYM